MSLIQVPVPIPAQPLAVGAGQQAAQALAPALAPHQAQVAGAATPPKIKRLKADGHGPGHDNDDGNDDDADNETRPQRDYTIKDLQQVCNMTGTNMMQLHSMSQHLVHFSGNVMQLNGRVSNVETAVGGLHDKVDKLMNGMGRLTNVGGALSAGVKRVVKAVQQSKPLNYPTFMERHDFAIFVQTLKSAFDKFAYPQLIFNSTTKQWQKCMTVSAKLYDEIAKNHPVIKQYLNKIPSRGGRNLKRFQSIMVTLAKLDESLFAKHTPESFVDLAQNSFVLEDVTAQEIAKFGSGAGAAPKTKKKSNNNKKKRLRSLDEANSYYPAFLMEPLERLFEDADTMASRPGPVEDIFPPPIHLDMKQIMSHKMDMKLKILFKNNEQRLAGSKQDHLLRLTKEAKPSKWMFDMPRTKAQIDVCRDIYMEAKAVFDRHQQSASVLEKEHDGDFDDSGMDMKHVGSASGSGSGSGSSPFASAGSGSSSSSSAAVGAGAGSGSSSSSSAAVGAGAIAGSGSGSGSDSRPAIKKKQHTIPDLDMFADEFLEEESSVPSQPKGNMWPFAPPPAMMGPFGFPMQYPSQFLMGGFGSAFGQPKFKSGSAKDGASRKRPAEAQVPLDAGIPNEAKKYKSGKDAHDAE